MTLTVNEVQIEWSMADSLQIQEAAADTSDAFTIHATAFQAQVELKANNDGTPGAGDTVDFYLLGTLGDPDGDSTDEYATTTHGIHLARLDTNVSNPAIAVVPIPMPLVGGQIYAVNNSAADDMTVSAIVLEHRSS